MSEPVQPVRRLHRPLMVSFDVFDDGRRRRVREVLRAHGDWFQQSLWIVDRSSRASIDDLTGELQPTLASEDRLLLHRPCTTCLRQFEWRPEQRTPRPQAIAVIS